LQETNEGSIETETVEGIPSYIAFSRSPTTKWTVGISVPRAFLLGEMWTFIAYLCLLALVLLAVGIVISWIIGDRISRSIYALIEPASALGAGEPVAIPRQAIQEVDDVARALAAASDLIRQRTEERDRARDKEREAERLWHLAVDASLKDALTGVANRRYFNELMVKEWRRSERERSWISFIMADVDHFKAFNDRYGHQAGDDCLSAVAVALSQGLGRPTDVLARYGGEEFVAILPGVNLHGAKIVAQRMLDHVRGLAIPHEGSSTAPYVTISLGVASCIPEPKSSPESLINEADAFLYTAKAKGRNAACSNEGVFSLAEGVRTNLSEEANVKKQTPEVVDS